MQHLRNTGGGVSLLLIRESFRCGDPDCRFSSAHPQQCHPPRRPARQPPLTTYYCQVRSSRVSFHYVDFPPEERAAIHLLYVLYGWVFCRCAAYPLGIRRSLKVLCTPL